MHAKLVNQAQQFHPGEKRAVIFLGDSITEGLVERQYGLAAPRAEGAAEVLKRAMAPLDVEYLVMGISGDQTQHLYVHTHTRTQSHAACFLLLFLFLFLFVFFLSVRCFFLP